MVRTQIQLTDEQARRLKRVSTETGRSVAALIRDAVDRLVDTGGDDPRWQRALRAVGKYRSGRADVSTAHDEHLAESYRR